MCSSDLLQVFALATDVGPDCEIILLGSIASGKYLEILTHVLGDRLRVPADFIGLGDMSRGGLLLRCVREQRELEYISAVGVVSSRTKAVKRTVLARPVIVAT